MSDTKEVELKKRTKKFAIQIIGLVRTMPKDLASYAIARQIIRSGTSVAANYRAACRAKSKPDFIAKLAIVEEEADETEFWLELIEESGLVAKTLTEPLRLEVNELISIMVSSIKTSRAGK